MRNSLTKILSRRFLCSLVFQIKQQQSVPFYFAFHLCFSTKRLSFVSWGKQKDRQTDVCRSRASRSFLIQMLQRRGRRQTVVGLQENLFSRTRSVLLTDGCNSRDLCETILKTKHFVSFFLFFCFPLNVVVFNLVEDAWDLLLHKNRGS